MPPEIETARLRLYPPRLDDLDVRLAMDRDPEVMRFIRPIPEDVAADRADIRDRILGPPPRGALWHVEERLAPGFLGWCGVFPLQDSGLMEIGYRFVRAAWGRGFATESAAALDHGFRCPALLRHALLAESLGEPPFRSRRRTADGRRKALTMPRRTRGFPPTRPMARRISCAISMGHYQRSLV